jgi:hypothetical protein
LKGIYTISTLVEKLDNMSDSRLKVPITKRPKKIRNNKRKIKTKQKHVGCAFFSPPSRKPPKY